ncbi:uncharacterized protein LOC143297002 [Babylonia areolata]|uniref:uncharacterized protein LOC143297002 n=1 Tax=Babylonia areolata TaxID=304850 RepID=UPI003FD4FD37
MGCGGSKNNDQTVPVKETKKEQTTKGKKGTKKEQTTTKGKERPRPKSAPQDRKGRDKSKSLEDSAGESNKKLSKEEQLRQELVAATESRDLARLEKAISDYERNQLPNSADLARARRVLVSLHEQALQAAIQEQKLDALEAAIDAANESPVSPELHDDPGETLQEAEELRSLLRRLRLYVHKVLALKPMTVSEIHSYKRPRPLVHSVMKATYLLLGERERQLGEWEYIQSLLRRQGRGSIIRRIQEFDPRTMKKAKVHRAEDHLKVCSKDKVRQTSAGAGTFYVWSYNIIKDGKPGGKKKT